MYVDFSDLFQQSSKDSSGKGRVHIPPDSSTWPKEWKTIYYKSYGKLPKIGLSSGKPHADFFEVIRKRHSSRKFTQAPVDKEKLSLLLQYSCGIVDIESGSHRRAYPSGGGRFPIEIYPLVFQGSVDIPAGVYHYNVREHALDVLWRRPFSDSDIGELFSYEWIQDASLAIVMTAVFERSQMKYGERGYRYVLLEAGHIGENVCLTAEALDLSCCAMGGVRDEKVERLLDIDGITEAVVHSLVLG
jgi:SagB-type dehydrogenase family enzyme